jgi:hypothetical protein
MRQVGVFVGQSSSVCAFGGKSRVILSPEEHIKAKIEAIEIQPMIVGTLIFIVAL